MKNIVNTYVEKFKADHRKTRRMVSLLLALALIVTAGVFWQLRSTGIALTNETYCGLTEHQHDEECYEYVLVCGLEETEGHAHSESCYETQTVLTCALEECEDHEHDESCYDEEGNLICGQDESEGHTHTDACYETEQVLICGLEETEGHTHTEECHESQLVCGLEEHTHTVDCMSDETADVETSDDWEATLPELTGVWADDVVAIAESQLGYTESTDNFTLDDDGETRRGYTRYGAWAGNEYGDWDAMFASFCLSYAGISTEDFPESTGAYAWSVKLQDAGLYADAAEYTPAAGDLVFFDTDDDGKIDTVGIITALDEENSELTVIQGDCVNEDGADSVVENVYAGDDVSIIGYGMLPEQEEVQEEASAEIEEDASDETETEVSAEPEAEEVEADIEADKGLVGSGDFLYEDEDVIIQVHVEGVLTAPASDESDEGVADTTETAASGEESEAVDMTEETASSEGSETADTAEEAASEEGTEEAGTAEKTAESDNETAETPGTDELSWDNVTMEVEVLDEESDSYALLAEYAEETEEESSEETTSSVLGAVTISFCYDGEEVDASDWEITAEVTPVEQVAEEAENAGESAVEETAEDTIEEDESEETETMVTYTLVETADGEVMEADTATVTSEDEEQPTLTVSLSRAKSAIAVIASEEETTNFTVEYYAYLDVVQTGTSGTLALLDTSAATNGTATLPTNSTTNAKTYITLEDNGSGQYQIVTTSELTQIYTSESCNVEEYPDVTSVNKLKENTGYTLYQIWVSTDSGSSWTTYDYADGMTFTNNSSAADTTTIYIPDDALVRLVYNTAGSSTDIAANLYDYDITDGDGDTYLSGINSSSNYSGSGAKLAFGNSNTKTGLESELLNGFYINRANSTSTVDSGCSFGIVTGLNSDGTIIYNSGIDAPNLFNEEGSTTGKTTYDGQTLTFSQVGDTYTLSSVSGPNYSISNLQYFTRLTQYVYSDGTSGSTFWNNSVIYTNNFWPMDGVTNADGSHGEYGNTGTYTSNGSTSYSYPSSDDSIAHNNYFGMQFAVNFTLDADYCGPLNYYFFGDDDMWVFLTDSDGNSTLICDIGGVHSSVGEYVDLWDYIEEGSSGTYTLTFFYTERGASGSSCYMQFTLPSVTSATTVQNTGSLKVEKEVSGTAADSEENFEFTLSLKDSNGDALTNSYSYVIYNEDGTQASNGRITNGETFFLKDGQYIIVGYLPVGTECTVTESGTDYVTTYTVDNGDMQTGNAASASSITNGNTSVVHFVNTREYELPSTGGAGTGMYGLIGLVLCGGAGLLLYRRRKKI